MDKENQGSRVWKDNLSPVPVDRNRVRARFETKLPSDPSDRAPSLRQVALLCSSPEADNLRLIFSDRSLPTEPDPRHYADEPVDQDYSVVSPDLPRLFERRFRLLAIAHLKAQQHRTPR